VLAQHECRARPVDSSALLLNVMPRPQRPPCRLICFTRKSNLAAPHAAKQHDGQITQNLSSALAKNISLSLSGKSVV